MLRLDRFLLSFALFTLTAAAPTSIDPFDGYHVVLDGGSTGTRIYIYTVANHLRLVEPVRINGTQWAVKTNPGLSSIMPEQVDDYLKPLLSAVVEQVPETERKRTTIALRATAGMRLLPEYRRQALLAAVMRAFKSQTPFQVDSYSALVIPGEFEGAFGWVTANYLQNKLTLHGAQTNAYIDLGGASAQITFEPLSPPLAGDFPVVLDGTRHELYTHSYLRFGIVQAHGRYYAGLKRDSTPGLDGVYEDPCLWKPDPMHLDASFEVKAIMVNNNGDSTEETIHVRGSGDPAKCEALVYKYSLMHGSHAQEYLCTQPPCTILGVHQPPIPSYMQVNAVSNFAEVAQLHKCATKENNFMAPATCIRDIFRKACSTMNLAEAANVYSVRGDALNRVCFQAIYVYSLSTNVFRIKDTSLVRWADDLKGSDLGWSLGSILYDVSQRQTIYVQRNDI